MGYSHPAGPTLMVTLHKPLPSLRPPGPNGSLGRKLLMRYLSCSTIPDSRFSVAMGSAIATPHLDRFALNGLRYASFHTTALCSGSHACHLTGRNHHAVGMRACLIWTRGIQTRGVG